MTTFREKYDFWTDRKIGGCIYRFSSFAIKRCAADDAAKHFRTWEDFETQAECIRAWRKICDKAAEENVDAVSSPRSTAKETD